MGVVMRGLDLLAILLVHRQTGNRHWRHRKGFRLFWTWKVRHGQPGRPPVSNEIRQLIRKMSRENRLWGAPRMVLLHSPGPAYYGLIFNHPPPFAREPFYGACVDEALGLSSRWL